MMAAVIDLVGESNASTNCWSLTESRVSSNHDENPTAKHAVLTLGAIRRRLPHAHRLTTFTADSHYGRSQLLFALASTLAVCQLLLWRNSYQLSLHIAPGYVWSSSLLNIVSTRSGPSSWPICSLEFPMESRIPQMRRFARAPQCDLNWQLYDLRSTFDQHTAYRWESLSRRHRKNIQSIFATLSKQNHRLIQQVLLTTDRLSLVTVKTLTAGSYGMEYHFSATGNAQLMVVS